MFLKQILALGVLSALIERTAQQPVKGSFCSEGDCYIRLETDGKSWVEAQQMCKKYNSTLPIVDKPNRERSFVAALYYFKMNGADVWLGAKASDNGPGNWRWLDGSRYSGTVVHDAGTYDKSYAFLSKTVSELLACASSPRETYSYICQYNTIIADVCTNGTGRLSFSTDNRCYVKYYDKLSWFKARNNCTEQNGDLASVSSISLLDVIVDSNGSWIGLRRSQWIWQNTVTGLSSDVAFTSWSADQPNDGTPSCISIDFYNFPKWKDRSCSDAVQYICQVLNTTISTPSTTYRISTEGPPASALATITSIRIETSGGPGYGSKSGSNNEVNVPLAIGLSVGLAAFLIVAIVVVIIVIVVRRKHRNNDSSGKSPSTETIAKHDRQMNSREETTEMNETRNGNQFKLDDASILYGQVKKFRGSKPKFQQTSSSSQSRSDEASTNYATVKEVIGFEPDSQAASSSFNQGPVYADLGFGESWS